jgi:hypothetical protein
VLQRNDYNEKRIKERGDFGVSREEDKISTS